MPARSLKQLRLAETARISKIQINTESEPAKDSAKRTGLIQHAEHLAAKTTKK